MSHSHVPETAEQTRSCQHPSAQPQSTTFGTPLPQTPVSFPIINPAPLDPQAPDAPSQDKAPVLAPPQPQELTGSTVKQTQSGQLIKTPKRLKDYVTN